MVNDAQRDVIDVSRARGFNVIIPESVRESRRVFRVAHRTRIAYHAHARESMQRNMTSKGIRDVGDLFLSHLVKKKKMRLLEKKKLVFLLRLTLLDNNSDESR